MSASLVKYVERTLLKDAGADYSLPADLGEFRGRVGDAKLDDYYSFGGAASAALGVAALTRLGGGNKLKALRNGAVAIFPGMFAGGALRRYNK